MAERTCSIEGCERTRYARGWCERHYRRWKTRGTTDLAYRPTLAERFWGKVERGVPGPLSTECWIWTGGQRQGGYGHFDGGGRGVYAHRMAYEMLVGPIPEGLQIDHLCRVPACVNPAHLEPVTQQENVRRGEAGAHLAAKTHCPQGHPYDEVNTYRAPGVDSRACRECHQQACARYRARRRGAA